MEFDAGADASLRMRAEFCKIYNNNNNKKIKTKRHRTTQQIVFCVYVNIQL